MPGTAGAVVVGGAPPFTYLWSNGQTTETATDLTAGAYSLTLTDVNGLQAVQTFVVTDQTPLLNLGEDLTLTAGETTTLVPRGEGLSYLWLTGETTATITVSTAGIYGVTVTNAAGCTATDALTVSFAVGVESVNALGWSLQVQPNPATDKVRLQITSPQRLSHATVELLNSAGAIVYQTTVSLQVGDNFLPLDVGPPCQKVCTSLRWPTAKRRCKPNW